MTNGDDQRPDPDRLLSQITAERAQEARGVLKIFFGYAAGVGKTYAMLRAAHDQKKAGVEVVVGYVEPHGRVETEALLSGLEQLPPIAVSYRGVNLSDFDLAGALGRRPRLIIVDEFAHTNAPGMRHRKRWQDILDLLEAGIDVYTTLNVQHIESLNDVVSKATGVVVRETVPDEVFDRAAQIEIIDLPPEELLRRLAEGKVYLPSQARSAMTRFFQKANLVALREIALRRAADRINIEVESARLARAELKVIPTAEHLLVCVGPTPTSADVIRQARRMALVFHAKWIALHVETSGAVDWDPETRSRLYENLRLAEELGAEVATIRGENVPAEILAYARLRNATKIVIGKHPDRRPLLAPFRKNIVSERLDTSGDIAVYVIPGLPGEARRRTSGRVREHISGRSALLALALLIATNLVSLALDAAGLSVANIVMVFVLGVFLVTVLCGRALGIVASVAGVLSFDVFFVPPRLSIAVSDTQYFLTFFVMLVVTLVTSTLTSRLSRQAQLSVERERRIEPLYRLTRNLSKTSGTNQIANIAESELTGLLRGEVVIFLKDEAGELVSPAQDTSSLLHDGAERAVARWALEHNQMAGLGTDTLPGAHALYLPLAGSAGGFGVLGIRPTGRGELRPEQRYLLETFAAQIALALERDQLAEESQKILVQAESERLRNSLLRSISHDIRSPLAGIAGASSTLLDKDEELRPEARKRLLKNIFDDANWLTQLVENLLSMTRLESESVAIARQWEAVDDIIASVLLHLKQRLIGRPVSVAIPPQITMVPMDGSLIEQVITNILDNAIKYTPEGSPIEIRVQVERDRATFIFADRGSGIAAEDLENLFVKFYRGKPQREAFRRGAGLGLSICKAIVDAHGGEIHAENRPGGGAIFSFSLPLAGENPLATIGEAGSPEGTDA